MEMSVMLQKEEVIIHTLNINYLQLIPHNCVSYSQLNLSLFTLH